MKKKTRIKSLLLAPLLFLLASCQFFDKKAADEGDKIIARVYDRNLYASDLANIIDAKANLSANDSASIVQNYITIWAKDQLMLYKAEYNLNEQQKNFKEQINKYENDLLKFAYQEEYLRQNLDTSISKSEIEEYYQVSKDNFLLKENILRANYLIVSKSAPQLDMAKKWFKSKDIEDLSKLRNFALKYATEYYLLDSSWVTLDQISSKIPIDKTEDQNSFLANNNFLELSDTNKIYLLEIAAYQLKGNHAPLNYLDDVIKNILINKKKLKLLADLEKNLLEDALKKKEFETY